MIQLYTWGTPNGKKASIMLEEIGLPYEVQPSISARTTSSSRNTWRSIPTTKFPRSSTPNGPGGKPFKLFESGAISCIWRRKSGKLWPADLAQRYTVIQWLMFQMGGVGPMFGQANYFYRLEEKVPYAIERFHKEAMRLYNVLDKEFGQQRISRRRILDRRYRDLSLGRAARWAPCEVGRVSQREALVRTDRQSGRRCSGGWKFRRSK